jgi:hypothetical protein
MGLFDLHCIRSCFAKCINDLYISHKFEILL